MPLKILPVIAALFLLLSASNAVAGGYSSTLKEGGYTIALSSPNKAVGNTLRISLRTPQGTQWGQTFPVEGLVTRAELLRFGYDYNAPLLVVFLTQPGSGCYGSVRPFALYGGIALGEVLLVPPSARDLRGYRGHDRFETLEGRLVRTFPIYKPTDVNAKPTGGTRQIQYRLTKGEGGWVFRPYRVFDMAP